MMLANLAAAQAAAIFTTVLAHVPPLEQIGDAGASAFSLAGQALAGIAFVLRLLPGLRTLRDFASSFGRRLAARFRHA